MKKPITTMREISCSDFKALSLQFAAVRRRSQLRAPNSQPETAKSTLAPGSLFHRLTCAAVKKKTIKRLQAELRSLVAAQSIVAHSGFHRPSRD